MTRATGSTSTISNSVTHHAQSASECRKSVSTATTARYMNKPVHRIPARRVSHDHARECPIEPPSPHRGEGRGRAPTRQPAPELVVQRVLMRPTPWSCFSRISTWIHAHLPHARECHASTEVAVAHQSKVCTHQPNAF